MRTTSRSVPYAAAVCPNSGASFRIDHPNPVAPGRFVRVYAANTTPSFERLVSAPGKGPSASADYAVVDEEGKVVVQGVYRDKYVVAGLSPIRTSGRMPLVQTDRASHRRFG